HVNPNRPTKVLHRAPGAADWEVWDLERAMSRVAELVKKSREETFIERLEGGVRGNMTPAISSHGDANLDNEENHIHQEHMRARRPAAPRRSVPGRNARPLEVSSTT